MAVCALKNTLWAAWGRRWHPLGIAKRAPKSWQCVRSKTHCGLPEEGGGGRRRKEEEKAGGEEKAEPSQG